MKALLVDRICDGTTVVATTSYGPFTATWHQVKSVSAVWTATTASFTLALEYSNDNTNWHAFATATAITNANGTVMWDVAATKDALYWRVTATRTSGTLATLKAYIAYTAR